jgi:hypothetical protein
MTRHLAALAVVALLAWAPGALAARPQVTTSVTPSPSLFGDVLHATLTVRGAAIATVQAGFAPYQVLRSSSTHAAHGGVVVTTWRFDLQCLEANCAPGPGPRNVSLSASRVRVGSSVVSVRFPAVRVETRATKQQVASPERSFLHPTSPPAPTYRHSPTALRRLLFGAAVLLVLLAAALLVPRRRRRPAPTTGALDPLGRALALVRASLSRPAPDRRRALGLLARTLRRRGDTAIAESAGDLAWSEPEPDPERIARLADGIERTR